MPRPVFKSEKGGCALPEIPLRESATAADRLTWQRASKKNFAGKLLNKTLRQQRTKYNIPWRGRHASRGVFWTERTVGGHGARLIHTRFHWQIAQKFS